jgi:hypothetical protein
MIGAGFIIAALSVVLAIGSMAGLIATGRLRGSGSSWPAEVALFFWWYWLLFCLYAAYCWWNVGALHR